MEKENKNKLRKIIISMFFLAIAIGIDKSTELPMWGILLIYLVPYLIAGFEVLKEAFEKLFHGELFDEDFLMSVATIGAMLIGFLPNAKPEFIEAVVVMMLFQVGELFEGMAEGKSEKSIAELMNIRPDYARIEKNGKLVKVNPEDVEIGEIIVIQPGDKIPMDGIIVEGKSSLNAVALTGESVPISVKEKDSVNSGCININGTIKIKVGKTFEESTASKIIDLVKNATEKKSKSEKFITKFSKYYTPIVVVLAILIAVVPPLILKDNFENWIQRALTFLVVSCPCALVISVPLAFFGGIGGASKNGILIKGSNCIDQISKIKKVVFDKTGTLTQGVFEVAAIHPDKYDENKLLHLAAHVERYSTHPIAISLKEAYEHEDDGCKVEEIEEIAGQGIKAKVNDDIVYVGNSKLMDELKIKWKKCDHTGTIIHVAINGEYFGHVVISDKIKKDSKDTVSCLRKNVIESIMLTGDHKDVAEAVAKELEIEKYYYELMPEDKLAKLDEIISGKQKNEAIAFVGDGINDSPVLAGADVGIAMGGIGSDSAIEAADVVIMNDEPSKIIKAIKIAKKTLKIAHQNIVFAIFIKVLVLILAAIGMAPMWTAVFADVGVTILAVLNSIRTLV